MQPHLLRAAHQKISKFNLKFLQQIRDFVDAILKLRGCAAERANFIAPNAPPPWSRRLKVLATTPAGSMVRWGPVARPKTQKICNEFANFCAGFFFAISAPNTSFASPNAAPTQTRAAPTTRALRSTKSVKSLAFVARRAPKSKKCCNRFECCRRKFCASAPPNA